jgi:plastocyanin
VRSWLHGLPPRWAVWAAVVAGVVLATPAPAHAADAVVDIHDYQYHSADVTVQAGASVTWTNGDTARHDVASTSGPEAFRSPELGQGESFTYTFGQAGAYAYLCTLHPDMAATVTVTPAPATTTVPVPATSGPDATSPAGADAPASTTTAAVGGGEVAAPVAPVAAVSDPDLAEASRPYLEVLAAVAVVLSAVGLLFGPRRRRVERP